jgi:hypothetical protein
MPLNGITEGLEGFDAVGREAGLDAATIEVLIAPKAAAPALVAFMLSCCAPALRPAREG